MPDACGNSADCINVRCHCDAGVKRMDWRDIALHYCLGDMQGELHYMGECPAIWRSGHQATHEKWSYKQQFERAGTQQIGQAKGHSTYLRPKQADGALLGSRSRTAAMRCTRGVARSA